MKLATRLYLSFIPVILLIGLLSAIYTWYSFNDRMEKFTATAKKVDIGELKELIRDPIFGYYIEDQTKGYLEDASRDIDDAKHLFEEIMQTAIQNNRSPVQYIFYDSALKPIVEVINRKQSSNGYELEKTLIQEHEFCPQVSGCNQPLSHLDNDRHNVVIPLTSPSSALPNKQIVGYLHSQYEMDLQSFRDETLTGMLDEFKIIGLQSILLVVLLYLLSRSITRPISEFAARVKQIPSDPVNIHPTQKSSIDELNILGKALEQMRDEIHMQQKDLILARDEAMSAARAKSVFLSHMSHELRTPMNSVLGLSELLVKTELKPRQKKYLNNITTSGKILMSVINDILDFSKIDEGKVEIETIPFSLEDLIQDIKNIFSERVEEKAISLEFTQVPDAIAVVIGDPLHLRQVLVNLIDNAIKFTPEGKIKIEISYQSQSENQVDVKFSIKDEGVGIPEASREKLFNAFMQADNTTTRKYGGTGLGLAISSRLVTLMKGYLEFNSIEGVGSDFYFTLPFTPAAEQDLPIRTDSWDMVSGVDIAGYFKVLVAEDNKINRLFISEVLKELGFKDFDVVNDGHEAVSNFKQKSYDLVPMDCQMPVMDGFSATRKIRELEQGGNPEHRTPIIALTAYALTEDKQKCHEAGMDDHISKPIDTVELKTKIANWLGFMNDKPMKPEIIDEEIPDETAELLANHFDEISLEEIKERIKKPSWRELVIEYIEVLPQDVNKLEDALSLKDAKALAAVAHSMRGATSIIRQPTITRICGELQSIASHGHTDGAEILINDLKHQVDSLTRALSVLLQLSKTSSAASLKYSD